MADTPTVRWGIVTTGKIAGWFVEDLLKSDWPDKSANHIIQAIGGSSIDKCRNFVSTIIEPTGRSDVRPTLYGSYQEVYDDPSVDCVYIGTPHSLHKTNCFDAIKAGKNVLCEKPFTMNLREAEEVFAAAKERDVFIMEAMWTRFFPLVRKLQHFLHDERRLGTIFRMFCDFGLDINIPNLPDDSRYKDPALGAGSLLDIGIYSLTWGLVALSGGVGEDVDDPEVASTQTIAHGVDVASSVLLLYAKAGGRQGICTSTTNIARTGNFARIEGSKGHMLVYGKTPASPERFVFHPNDGGEQEFRFEKPGRGLFWETDAVARDLQAGRKQDPTMPWAETMRMMRIMDGVRKRSGARFPGDDW